jgi:steroid delta-isomerase-like uncharacterized protein
MTDQNKDLANRFYGEVFDPGDVDRVPEFCAEDFVDHEPQPPGMPEGIEGVKAFIQMFHAGFPDVKASVEDVLAEGDRVVARVRFTGTHQGEFMGVPATGKRIDMETIDIVRVVDGKAVEHWGVTDNMALMQQIGAIPEEAPA